MSNPVRLLVLALTILSTAVVGVAVADEPAPVVRTSKERLSFVTSVSSTVSGYVSTLNSKLTSAQAAADTVLINCLTDKLALIQPLSIVAVDAASLMSTAVATDNVDAQEQEYTRSAIASKDAKQYYDEAMACVNRKGAAPGQPTVRVVNNGGSDAGDQGFGSASNGATRNEDASPDGG